MDLRSAAIIATGQATSGQYQLFNARSALSVPPSENKLKSTARGNKLAIATIQGFLVQIKNFDLSKKVHKIIIKVMSVKRLLEVLYERPSKNKARYHTFIHTFKWGLFKI